MQAGPVAFDRFLLLISAESDTATKEMRGKVVLRGESPSNRLRPADTYQFFLGALGAAHGRRAMHMNHQAGHADGSMGWAEAPMYPGLDMLPSEMALRPAEAPWLPAADPAAPVGAPAARWCSSRTATPSTSLRAWCGGRSPGASTPCSASTASIPGR